MSGPPRENLQTHDGEELEESEENRELYLRDGRKLVVRNRLASSSSRSATKSGMLEVRIRLTEEGPSCRWSRRACR